jgi:hypothetical protein
MTRTTARTTVVITAPKRGPRESTTLIIFDDPGQANPVGQGKDDQV